MSGKATDAVERFWRKVDKDGPLVSAQLGPCWQWLGKPHRSGYGRHSPRSHAVVYAHCFAYGLLVGEIPAELQVDHLCRNRMCVRPDHLEAVTQQVNMLRGVGPQAVNARKTHCPQGHPLSGDNAYMYTVRVTGTPGRRCKTCNTENARAYRQRLAAKRVAA